MNIWDFVFEPFFNKTDCDAVSEEHVRKVFTTRKHFFKFLLRAQRGIFDIFAILFF